MKNKISIILPVYNVEEYIDRCLESIVNQTYKNLEIILVDDGSPDNSGKKCDEWAKKDKRIKVIHKENGGVSSARNVGLDNATGDYIGFIDPDDFIDHRMYEKLYNKIVEENADISMCKFYSYYSEDKIIKMNEKNLIGINSDNYAGFTINTYHYKVSDDEIITDNIMGSLCRSLFRKKTIGDLRLRNLKYAEDLAFYLNLLNNKPKFVTIDEYLYYYFIRNDSSVRKASKSTFDNRIEFVRLMDELYSDKVTNSQLSCLRFNIYRDCAMLVSNCGDKQVKKYLLTNPELKQLNKRKNYKCKQKDTKGIRDKLINFLMHYKLFGLYGLLRKLKGK